MRSNAWLELDFDILRQNLERIRAALSAHTAILLVVKANAYGHGMADVARCARDAGVCWFVVSRMDEAVELRDVLPDARILLLGAVWPTDVPEVLARGITPVVTNEEQGRFLGAEARSRGAVLSCHAKIDTGMGRLGLAWAEAPDVLVRLEREGGLRFEGLCTHFASAGRTTDPFAVTQAQRFDAVTTGCAARGLTIPFRHMANSAAFSVQPDWDLEGVRSGILAYGYGSRRSGMRVRTEPFLQWKTRVIQVKRVAAGFPVSYLSTHVTEHPTVLATLDVGYSDGYSRLLSNKGCVLIGGRRARVVGRVTMNFTVVDAGPDHPVQVGDEAVLIGRQGTEQLWADELARWCQTIPYEIVTSIRSLPRRPYESPAGAPSLTATASR